MKAILSVVVAHLVVAGMLIGAVVFVVGSALPTA